MRCTYASASSGHVVVDHMADVRDIQPRAATSVATSTRMSGSGTNG